MSIVIDKEKCRSCGSCTQVCPGNLIKKDREGKAYIKYSKDCWGCCSCIKECRFDAINFYLGADIGGMRSKMSIKVRGQYLDWNISKRDGTIETIIINKKESNKY